MYLLGVIYVTLYTLQVIPVSLYYYLVVLHVIYICDMFIMREAKYIKTNLSKILVEKHSYGY